MVLKKKPEKRSTAGESVHVRLDSPMTLRKDVLSLAVETIALLKRYYELQELRRQKDGITKILRTDINEIKRLAKELDIEEMPLTAGQIEGMHPIHPQEKQKLKPHVEEKPVEVREEKKKPEPAPKIQKQAKQQPKDRLETELEDLRRMISSI